MEGGFYICDSRLGFDEGGFLGGKFWGGREERGMLDIAGVKGWGSRGDEGISERGFANTKYDTFFLIIWGGG